LAVAAVAVAAYVLFRVGFIGAVLRVFSAVVRGTVARGFRLWEQYFSSAAWWQFLVVVLALIANGYLVAAVAPVVTVLCGGAAVFMGVTACLAYMFIDIERYEVERGYKAVHNPMKGQALAVHLIRHGDRVGVLLLAAAAVGAIGGFALLNQGLYESVGRSWFRMGDDKMSIGYADFLAYSLISLYRVVDLLDVVNSYNFLRLNHVTQAKWPAGLLLTAYKTFFTLVLLQQIFASIRQGQALAEAIADFWSPHPPIHERARNSLPQHGVGVVRPLLASLRSIPAMTREQRDQLPQVIATLGPASIPALVEHLNDENEGVRAVAAAALGRLNALDALPRLVAVRTDASEIVRQEVVEALGVIGGPGLKTASKRSRLSASARASRHSFWPFRRRASVGDQPEPDRVELIVGTLRAALSDEAATVRLAAVHALGLVGSPAADAVPELVRLLADADETVQCRAAESLGQIGGEAAVPPLVEKLADPSPTVKAEVAKALGGFKQAKAAIVPKLIELLKDPEQGVRQAAMDTLGGMDSLPQEATASLVEGLQSPDSLVRVQAAEALVVIGKAAPEAAPALVASLTNGDDHVRAKAAEALGKIGDAAGAVAVPGLVRALRDQSTWVSAVAAEALGEIGESAEDAVPALVRSLRHINPLVRANAAEALGKMGAAATSAVAALDAVVADPDGGVRARVLQTLGEIAPAEANTRRVIHAGLCDPDPRVRAAAAETLGKSGPASDVTADQLLPLLEDANDEVKYEAILALPRVLGPSPAVVDGLCRRLLEDDSPWIQATAAQALGVIGAAAATAGDALLRAVRTGEASVREQALRAMAYVQPPEAAAAFVDGMKDGNAEVRKMATAGWMKAASIPEAAVQSLVDCLRDPEVQVRANAAFAVSRLEQLPPAAVPLLTECVADPNDGLRLNAAVALKATPAEQTRDVWPRLIDDPNPRVRLVAAGAVLADDPDHAEAANVVTAALADPALRIRRIAVDVLASLGQAGKRFRERLKARVGEEQNEELRVKIDGLVAALDAPASTDPAAPE
jgi:HEAT repeat protein